jgi:hypothetical protein
MSTAFDPARFAQVASDHFLPKVEASLGSKGVADAKLLLDRVRELYGVIAYELLPAGLTVILDEDGRTADPFLVGTISIATLSDLPMHNDGSLTVRFGASGSIVAWKDVATPGMVDPTVIAYHFDGQESEQLLFADQIVPLFNPTQLPTLLGAPTFLDIEEALDHYATRQVRFSTCYILARTWRDNKRLMFLPKPESSMRRSLEQHLRSILRDHLTVRPEQTVDESHPVDIRVTWTFRNREALIEIKWLGKSARANGTTVTKNYTASRAHDGAQQLADYLDAEVIRAPLMNLRGYLVIYDARRRGVSPHSAGVTRANGLHYEGRDIELDSSLLARPDFGVPTRMFVEPICD